MIEKRIRLYSSLQSVARINLLGVAVLVAGLSSAFSTWAGHIPCLRRHTSLRNQAVNGLMSDEKSKIAILEIVTTTMNELAQELGAMELDDPRRASFVKELSDLMQLRRSLRLGGNQSNGQRMDELAREMTTIKPGDPRRVQIVHEIMRLRDLVKES